MLRKSNKTQNYSFFSFLVSLFSFFFCNYSRRTLSLSLSLSPCLEFNFENAWFHRSSSGKLRGSQVNKIVEILNLGIYCNSLEEASNSFGVDNGDESFLVYDSRFGFDSCDYMLDPFDVVLSMVVCDQYYWIFYLYLRTQCLYSFCRYDISSNSCQ